MSKAFKSIVKVATLGLVDLDPPEVPQAPIAPPPAAQPAEEISKDAAEGAAASSRRRRRASLVTKTGGNDDLSIAKKSLLGG